jgi:hypothetical protein
MLTESCITVWSVIHAKTIALIPRKLFANQIPQIVFQKLDEEFFYTKGNNILIYSFFRLDYNWVSHKNRSFFILAQLLPVY